jgi:hypothetical protein
MTTAIETRTAREDFLATHPKERELQAAQIMDICASVSRNRKILKNGFGEVVRGAEDARQTGMKILAFVETLPGKEFTEDFWLQLAPLFVDTAGNQIDRETLEWYVKIARKYTEPIVSMMEVVHCQKLLLLTTGEKEYELVGEREPQSAALPPDYLEQFRRFFEGFDLMDKWKAFMDDPKKCPDGKIREDLKPIMAAEFGPKLKQYDAFSAELHRELGV